MPTGNYHSDSLTTTARRSRASKSKVRSGCVTCKARRVKCDETKPACNRCSKFGRQCGGYKHTTTFEDRIHEVARGGTRSILPKTSERPLSYQPLQPKSPIQMDLSLSFHQAFCVEVATELCRIVELPKWINIISHFCQQHILFRHAITAVNLLSGGAISKLVSSLQPCTPIPFNLPPATEMPLDDRRVALLHYDKFLEGSRFTFLESTDPVMQSRIATLGCIFTIILESLLFHHEQVLNHTKMGLKLVSEWGLGDNTPPHSPGVEPTSPAYTGLEAEITSVFRILEAKIYDLETRLGAHQQAPIIGLYQTMSAPESSVPRRLSSQAIDPQLIAADEEKRRGSQSGLRAPSTTSRSSSLRKFSHQTEPAPTPPATDPDPESWFELDYIFLEPPDFEPDFNAAGVKRDAVPVGRSVDRSPSRSPHPP